MGPKFHCPFHIIYSHVTYHTVVHAIYEGVSKRFRIGRLERVLQMIQLSATRCSFIAILWASLVSFAAITLCIPFQRVFIVASLYFVIDSVRILLDTPRGMYIQNIAITLFCYRSWQFSKNCLQVDPYFAMSLANLNLPWLSFEVLKVVWSGKFF